MEPHMIPDPPLPPDPMSSASSQDSVKMTSSNRSRKSSRATPIVHQQDQPIQDAVHDAVGQTPMDGQLDPDFMRQLTERITKEVLKNLQAANLSNTTIPPSRQTTLQSEVDTATPPKDIETPLDKNGNKLRGILKRNDSRVASPTSPIANSSYDSLSDWSSPSDDSDDAVIESGHRKYRSQSSQSESAAYPSNYEAPSVSDEAASDIVDDDRLEKGEASRKDSANSPEIFERDGKTDQQHTSDTHGRASDHETPEPADPDEPTPLEKVWQPLFINGEPTHRAGQFIRGIAKYLIHEFEPRNSLVVTPAKMQRFFTENKLAGEHYPWDTIFGGKMSPAHLSKMYTKLLCQHHLVQTSRHETPFVPALTTQGFEIFLTCLIQAHPEAEYKRLSNVVRKMPICNADDRNERLPKELSRRLFPQHASVQAEQRLIASLNHEPLVNLAREATTMPPPPPHPTQAPPQSQPYIPPTLNKDASYNERERAPYSTSKAYSSAFEDDDLRSQPASGDRHRRRDREQEPGREASRSIPNQYRSEPPPAPRPGRTNSSYAAQGRPPQPPPIATAPPGSSGRRSSPGRNPYLRSEPNNLNDIPSSQYASNLRSIHPDDDANRRYAARRPSEPPRPYLGDDDRHPRGHPIPQRTPSSVPTYNASYPSGPGSSSFGGRANETNMPDDRRRSAWYGPGSVPSSGEGYANFTPRPSNANPYPPSDAYGTPAQTPH